MKKLAQDPGVMAMARDQARQQITEQTKSQVDNIGKLFRKVEAIEKFLKDNHGYRPPE
jgi:ABC-type enterochelin transport system substrate-binding protein